jgi:hypothetical protein
MPASRQKDNMTAPEQNQAQTPQEQQPSNKELNFRALENKMVQAQRRAEEAERRAQQAENMAQEALQKKQVESDDEGDDEPYVGHKRLARQFSSFEKKMDEKIDKRAEEKARTMVQQERQQGWLRQNPDFYDVMQHADRFADKDPELAETILQMPEGFERQKLVYKTIKAMGIHKPEEKKSTIQDKVDANRRGPFYQPSGVGTAPYGVVNGGKDYSPAEGKNAYAKMQELKSKLRI